jgi:hypothetical protein
MTLRNGSWTNRTDPMYDHSHEMPSKDYSLATVELEHHWWQDVPWGQVAAAIVIALIIFGACKCAGCFDR